MFALNMDRETNRILSATYKEFAVAGMPVVDTLPEGDISDYLFVGGEYVFDRLQKEVVE